MRIYITLFPILFLSLNIFAQQGKMEGKVVDAKTNAPLALASVTIDGSQMELLQI